MKIIQLKKVQAELFGDMDPLMMLEKLEFPGFYALGAVETTENNGDIPAGLMIISVHEEQLVIEWLYVRAEYQAKGIGENLLCAAFDMAEGAKLSTVFAYVNQEYGREQICIEEEAYFKERLFDAEQELAGEWLADLRTMAMESFFREQVQQEAYKQIAFSKFPDTKVQEVLEVLMNIEGATTLYPIRKAKQQFDGEVSILLYNKQEICGGMLVQNITVKYNEMVEGKIVKKINKVLYPVLFCARTEEAAKVLLYDVFQAVSQKYPVDMDFRLMIRSKEFAGLLAKIFPMQRTKSKYLIADVSEYVSMKRRKEKYEQLREYL